MFMRTSVEDGDTEMVDMLINAKADVHKRGINVSTCMSCSQRGLLIVCVLLT